MTEPNPFVRKAVETAAAAFAAQRTNEEMEADAFAQYVETLDSAVDHCERLLGNSGHKESLRYIDAMVTIAEQRARAYGVLPDLGCCCD